LREDPVGHHGRIDQIAEGIGHLRDQAAVVGRGFVAGRAAAGRGVTFICVTFI
jgi:hypothetical protein